MYIQIVKIKCPSRLSILRKSQLPLDLKRIPFRECTDYVCVSRMGGDELD